MTHHAHLHDYLTFTVRATAVVDDHQLEQEDLEVPGEYEFTLPAHAAAWTSSQQAHAVLDDFHNSIAIGCLDDFEITVLDAQGQEIYDEEYDEEDNEDE